MARRRPRDAAEVQPTITRKEYLRRHKDDRQRRALFTVLATVLLALGAFLGLGLYQQWQTLHAPVARVEGETITATQFQKHLAYQRYQMLRNMASLQQYAQASDASFMEQLFGSQRTNLPQSTVDQLIDEALIRQEARRRGIDVPDDAVETRINQELAPLYMPPTPTAKTSEEESPQTPRKS